jgi:formate hydrogenlyase subunit 4
MIRMRWPSYILVLAGLLLAPLLPGVVNRTKACFAGRRGPPLLQLYFDLAKLLRKGAVYSRTTTWVFRAAPCVSLAALLLAALLVPAPGVAAAVGFEGSLFALVGLLALARFVTVAAALDTGSSFEGMGGSREVQFAALAEPALVLVLAALAYASRSLALDHLFLGVTPRLWQGAAPAVGILAAALIVVLLVENCRIPFDDPNTHLELTMIHEVMVLDYGGPDLAFILYGASLKLWIFGALLVNLLLPWQPAAYPWLGVPLLCAGLLAVAVVVGVVESVMARLRLVAIPHLLLGASALAALGFLLVMRGGV